MLIDGGGVSPYGIVVVKHSLGPKHSTFLDCEIRGCKTAAVSLEETPLNGTLIDFVNTLVDGGDLEPGDFRITLMHPATVIRVQRRDGTAYQLRGSNAAMTTIGRFWP
ncbi:MAG: hypothetical protein ACT4PO_01510 [Actinomycetota bacterium]